MAPRIPPIPREEWTDGARDVFAFWEGEPAWEEGSGSLLTMTLAQHPVLAMKFYPFGKQLLVNSLLPARQRELLTLRISWLYKCEYEWGHHLQWARNAGLTEEEIEALKGETDDYSWGELDLAVLRAIDQLRNRSQIDDELWNTLSRHFDKQQLMELVLMIGHYVMLSWAIGVWGVELEQGDWPRNYSLS